MIQSRSELKAIEPGGVAAVGVSERDRHRRWIGCEQSLPVHQICRSEERVVRPDQAGYRQGYLTAAGNHRTQRGLAGGIDSNGETVRRAQVGRAVVCDFEHYRIGAASLADQRPPCEKSV